MDTKKAQKLIDAAKAAKAAGDSSSASDKYLQALRIITPDDARIAFAMAAQQFGATIKVEAPMLDMIDSNIRSELVSLFRTQAKPKEALHHADIALYLDKAVHGEMHNNTSASFHDLALVHLDLADIDKALECFQKSEAIDKNTQVLLSAPKEVAWRAVMRSSILAEYGYVEQAARFAFQNMGRFPELFSEEPEKLVRAYDRGCQSLQNIGEHAKARPFYKNAVDIAQSKNLSRSLQSILLANFTQLLIEQGQFETAGPLALEYDKLTKNKLRFHAGILEEKQLIDRWRERSATIENRGGRLHDFFISFNTKQKSMVDNLHNELKRRGFSCWVFQEAEDWKTERSNEEITSLMREEIDRSRIIIALGSSTSLTSKFVTDELDYAIKKNVPVLMWYPEGVRLQPRAASTWSTMSPEDHRAFTLRLSGQGVYSYYGYGLRNRDVSVIADAVIKRFAMIYQKHKSASLDVNNDRIREALDPTRLWPIVIDSKGTVLVPELIHLGLSTKS